MRYTINPYKGDGSRYIGTDTKHDFTNEFYVSNNYTHEGGKIMRIENPFGGNIPIKISAPFGQQRIGRTHKGIDIPLIENTEIYSPIDGVVMFSGWQNDVAGNAILIRNGDTIFGICHLNKCDVTQGQTVTAGQLIGLSGNTGKSTGPHAHISWSTVNTDGIRTFCDPYPYLKEYING